MITREEFKLAFDDVVSREFDFVKDMPEHTFSRKFERKMNRLIKTVNKHGKVSFFTLHKPALIAASCLCILIAATMQVDAIRQPVINFITEVYERFIHITFDNSSVSNSITCEYQLTFIPDDFSMTDYQKTSTHIYSQYENESGNIIILAQDLITNNSELYLDNENGTTKTLIIADTEVLLYDSDFGTFALWVQDNYRMDLTLIGDFDEETVIKLIESIEAVETDTAE